MTRATTTTAPGDPSPQPLTWRGLLSHTSPQALWWLALLWVIPQGVPVEGARVGGFEVTGDLIGSGIDESSGLAVSRRHEGVLWTHNDSGDGPWIMAISASGALRARVRLEGVSAVDFEDMAWGPCTSRTGPPEGSCLYIGDIGDNRHRRRHVHIYQVREPDLPPHRAGDTPTTLTARPERAWHVRYPDGPHDAESLLVHPRTGHIWLVRKARKGRSLAFEAPLDAEATTSRAPGLMRPLGALDPGRLDLSGRLFTGGDIAPDGRCLAMRTYQEVLLWCAPADDPSRLGEVFSAQPPTDRARPPIMLQAESIAFSPSGDTLWMTTERTLAPILRARVLPPAAPKKSQSPLNR